MKQWRQIELKVLNISWYFFILCFSFASLYFVSEQFHENNDLQKKVIKVLWVTAFINSSDECRVEKIV